jgi:hypothetical protein
MAHLPIVVLTGILHHVSDKHQPAAALLDEIHPQESKRVCFGVLRFSFRLFLKWIEFLLQLSDRRKGNASQTHAWASQQQ